MKKKYAEALMDMACRFGETSEAKRLQVGALLYKNGAVVSLGTNGQPPGWKTEVCEDSDGNTLPTVRHAEHACLEKMYLSNETTEGAYMFVSHSPCLHCSLRIVAAKIAKVFYKHEYRSDEGLKYLKENGIVVFQMKEEQE